MEQADAGGATEPRSQPHSIDREGDLYGLLTTRSQDGCHDLMEEVAADVEWSRRERSTLMRIAREVRFSPEERSLAIWALGEIGEIEAVAAALQPDRPESVRLAAAETLRRSGAHSGAPALAALVRADGAAAVRAEALRCLVDLDPAAAFPVAAGTAGAESPTALRRAALEVLGRTDTGASFEVLGRLDLDRADPETALAAADALFRLREWGRPAVHARLARMAQRESVAAEVRAACRRWIADLDAGL